MATVASCCRCSRLFVPSDHLFAFLIERGDVMSDQNDGVSSEESAQRAISETLVDSAVLSDAAEGQRMSNE